MFAERIIISIMLFAYNKISIEKEIKLIMEIKRRENKYGKEQIR